MIGCTRHVFLALILPVLVLLRVSLCVTCNFDVDARVCILRKRTRRPRQSLLAYQCQLEPFCPTRPPAAGYSSLLALSPSLLSRPAALSAVVSFAVVLADVLPAALLARIFSAVVLVDA